MVLHHDRKVVCSRCNAVLFDAWKDHKHKSGGRCGTNWAEKRQRREVKRELRAFKRAARHEFWEEKRQIRAHRRAMRSYSF
jgi:hypothetical protein